MTHWNKKCWCKPRYEKRLGDGVVECTAEEADFVIHKDSSPYIQILSGITLDEQVPMQTLRQYGQARQQQALG